jgi:hypothetical protein
VKRYQRFLRTHPQIQEQSQPGTLSAALLAAVEPLQRRHIPYAVAGRLACSIYGLHSAVSTIELWVQHPRRLVLSAMHTRHDDSYLDVLHLMRVDVTRTNTAFDALPQTLFPDQPPIMMLSPETVTVDLLEHFAATGACDDALYNDLLGMVKVQSPHMDVSYMYAHSQHHALLAQLLDDAGVTP